MWQKRAYSSKLQNQINNCIFRYTKTSNQFNPIWVKGLTDAYMASI